MGALAAIFILGLFLRFSVLAGTVVDTPVRADAKKYVTYAYNLSQYGVYSGQNTLNNDPSEQPKPDAVITPGYPVYLSLFFDKGPIKWSQLKASLVVQTFLSALSVVMIFYIFSPTLGAWAGLAVALLTALSPHLVSANTYLLTESLFSFLMVLWLLLLSRITCRTTLGALVISGMVLAVAVLTRSWIQYFVILLLPFLLWVSGNPLFRMKRKVGAFFIGYMMILLIWITRNYITLGVSGDSRLMLATLQGGMYPGMMYDFIPESFGVPYRFDPSTSLITTSLSSFFSMLWARVSEDPWVYLEWYLYGKAVMVLSWDIIAGFGDVFVYPIVSTPYQEAGIFKVTHSVMKLLHVPITLLAILGAVTAWVPRAFGVREGNNTWLMKILGLLFLYFILIHTIASPYPRYSIPIRPLTYGLAVYMVGFLWDITWVRLRQKRD